MENIRLGYVFTATNAERIDRMVDLGCEPWTRNDLVERLSDPDYDCVIATTIDTGELVGFLFYKYEAEYAVRLDRIVTRDASVSEAMVDFVLENLEPGTFTEGEF